ncbi:hypothetical protein P885DRAFT_74730 [Corynascus similis CBS 632.67]
MPSSFFALAHDSLMVAVMILLFVWAALMLVSRRRWANPANNVAGRIPQVTHAHMSESQALPANLSAATATKPIPIPARNLFGRGCDHATHHARHSSNNHPILAFSPSSTHFSTTLSLSSSPSSHSTTRTLAIAAINSNQTDNSDPAGPDPILSQPNSMTATLPFFPWRLSPCNPGLLHCHNHYHPRSMVRRRSSTPADYAAPVPLPAAPPAPVPTDNNDNCSSVLARKGSSTLSSLLATATSTGRRWSLDGVGGSGGWRGLAFEDGARLSVLHGRHVNGNRNGSSSSSSLSYSENSENSGRGLLVGVGDQF